MELPRRVPIEPRPVDDPEWVIGLLDDLTLGDLDQAAQTLERLARRLRKAAKAKRMLVNVPMASVRIALEVRRQRRGSS